MLINKLPAGVALLGDRRGKHERKMSELPESPNVTEEFVDSNITDEERSAIIKRLNDEMASLMVPATIYISVLMVFGLFGNLMVCYYYGFKTKRTTNSLFIVILAVYDVVVCSICMPTEIVDIELNYTFENNAACKILRFVNYLAGIGSILTLIAIATDRFKKICRSTKPQMSIKSAKWISLIIFGVSVLLSWPSLAIYGSIKVNIPYDLDIGLKGSDCTSTKDKKYRGYVWAFNVVHFVMFFVCSIILIVLYSVIGKSIFSHHKRLRKYSSIRKTVSSTNETSLSQTTEEVTIENNAKNKTSDNMKGQQINAFDNDNNKNSRNKSEKEDKNKLQMRSSKVTHRSEANSIDSETLKLTMVMIIVTVVFIISFLPYLSLTVWRVMKGKHEAEFLSGSGLVGFKIGSRSFLLNSSLNPWIYGIFNSNFRRFFCGRLCCRSQDQT